MRQIQFTPHAVVEIFCRNAIAISCLCEIREVSWMIKILFNVNCMT